MRPLSAYFPPEPQPISCDDDPDRCNNCALYRTLCIGCVEAGKRDDASPHYCFQGNCGTGCGSCGGAKGADTPALCCKSPAKDALWPELQNWKDPAYRPPWWGAWHTADTIDFKSSSINISQHASSIRDPYLPDTEVWAVSLRHLRSLTKWVTSDAVAHLGLPEGTKLISLTSMKDDVLEDMWNTGMLGGPDFTGRGISHVMPLMFSNYTAYGQMMSAYMAIRSLEACVAGKCDYVPINWAQGLRGAPLVLEAVAHVPNVILNAQFVRNSIENWMLKLKEIVQWHLTLPLNVTLSLIGISKGEHIVTIRQMLKGRRLYFLSSTPFLGGTRGRYYTKRGEEKAAGEDVPRQEILHENQNNFRFLCDTFEPPPLNEEQKRWLNRQRPLV